MTIEQQGQQEQGQQQEQQPAGGGTSALVQAGGAGQQAAEWTLPEKFAVKTESGELDYKASMQKLGESYGELEKRLGSGDAPPASDDDYKVEGIEGFNFDEFKAIPENKAFIKAAHAKGMTNAQLGFVLGEYNRIIPEVVGNMVRMNADECNSTLQKEWGESAGANYQAAYRAGAAAGLTQEQMDDPAIGSNPTVVKLLAFYGNQLGEDRPPSGGGFGGGEDLETLMRNPAYFDQNHPDHKAVTAKVARLYERGAKLSLGE